jgi:histidine triad (HIT) family protein
MRHAAEYCKHSGIYDYNIITSMGEYATQTVFHLHVHIVPRRLNDGLHLPWTELVDTK